MNPNSARATIAPATGAATRTTFRVVQYAPHLLILAAFGLGVFRAFWRVANHDVAWLLYAARRVLDGATLYRDIVEINLPLTVWLHMPAAALARFTGLPDTSIFQAGVLAVGVASLATSLHLLPVTLPDASPTSRAWLGAALSAAFFVVPAYAFAQREHLMVLLVTPYLVAAIARARGVRLPSHALVVIGAAAGLGLAIKPHFVVVWLASEGLLLRHDSARRSWRRPEALASAAVIGLSLLAIPVFTPQYADVVRDAPLAYRAFGAIPPLRRLRMPGFLFAALALAFALVCRRGSGVAPRVVASVVGGLLVMAFLQGKSWSYHYYPAVALSVVLVALLLYRTPSPWMRVAMITYTFVVVGAAVRETVATDPPGGRRGSARREFETLVRSRAPHGSIALFSDGYRVVFPLVNRTGVRWALRYSCMWKVPALEARRANGRNDAGDPRVRAFMDTVVTDLEHDLPTLLFVDTGPTQPVAYLSFFSRDGRFAALLARYDSLPPVGTYRVLQRRR